MYIHVYMYLVISFYVIIICIFTIKTNVPGQHQSTKIWQYKKEEQKNLIRNLKKRRLMVSLESTICNLNIICTTRKHKCTHTPTPPPHPHKMGSQHFTPPPPPPPHTHTHAYTHTMNIHIHTHIHARVCPHIHTRACKYINIHDLNIEFRKKQQKYKTSII